MATYTDNYNLKMPSVQDAPDVEDFNTNAEIIDKALDAHANNFADKYDPNSTYTEGALRIQNDALWKAKQNIDVAEPWTESHWELTTLAKELSALNSNFESGVRIKNVVVITRNINIESDYVAWETLPYTFPAPLEGIYAGLVGVHAASGTSALFFVRPSGEITSDTAITSILHGTWSLAGAYVASD